jgi:hypothetical protein
LIDLVAVRSQQLIGLLKKVEDSGVNKKGMLEALDSDLKRFQTYVSLPRPYAELTAPRQSSSRNTQQVASAEAFYAWNPTGR